MRDFVRRVAGADTVGCEPGGSDQVCAHPVFLRRPVSRATAHGRLRALAERGGATGWCEVASKAFSRATRRRSPQRRTPA